MWWELSWESFSYQTYLLGRTDGPFHFPFTTLYHLLQKLGPDTQDSFNCAWAGTIQLERRRNPKRSMTTYEAPRVRELERRHLCVLWVVSSWIHSEREKIESRHYYVHLSLYTIQLQVSMSTDTNYSSGFVLNYS